MKKPILTSILLLTLSTLLSGCTGVYHPYRVAGNSMSPLLREGDGIFVDQSQSSRTDLHDGDVIAFHHNDGVLIKRLMAMPGETISATDRKVFRNGKPVDEPYLAPPNQAEPYMPTFAPRTIPAGELFVMGDNRDLSMDSRMSNYTVHPSDVVGKYVWTYAHAAK